MSIIDKILSGTIIIGVLIISTFWYLNIVYTSVFGVIYTLVLWDDIYDKFRVSYIILFVAFKTGKIGSDVRLNDIVVLAFL